MRYTLLMKYLFFTAIAVLVFLPYKMNAQSNDVLSLYKKGRVVKTYFAGDNIEFSSISGAYRDALITAIKNDSIYLQEFLVYKVPTTYGGFVLDTAGSFRYKYGYKEIYSFGPKAHRGFNVGGSGRALLGGGAVLSVASLVVLAADKNKFSPVLLGAGLGGIALGYVLSKTANKAVIVGKNNYYLKYTNLQK